MPGSDVYFGHLLTKTRLSAVLRFMSVASRLLNSSEQRCAVGHKYLRSSDMYQQTSAWLLPAATECMRFGPCPIAAVAVAVPMPSQQLAHTPPALASPPYPHQRSHTGGDVTSDKLLGALLPAQLNKDEERLGQEQMRGGATRRSNVA